MGMVIASRDPATVQRTVRQIMDEKHPGTEMQFYDFQQGIMDSLAGDRMMARLSGFFGILAALLVMVGLHGVLSYFLAQRRSEIGIRMALGAAHSSVIGTVMRGAMLQAITGLAIGIPVAIFCVRYLKSQLFEITSVNVPVMSIPIGVLVLTAAIAGIIPALRAACIDPVQALRIE